MNAVKEIVVHLNGLKDPVKFAFDATHKMSIRQAKKLNRLLRQSKDVVYVEILADVW